MTSPLSTSQPGRKPSLYVTSHLVNSAFYPLWGGKSRISF